MLQWQVFENIPCTNPSLNHEHKALDPDAKLSTDHSNYHSTSTPNKSKGQNL